MSAGLQRTPPRSLLFAVWLLLGAPVLYYGAESIQGARDTLDSRHWPHVTGTIVKHETRGRKYCSVSVIHYTYVVRDNAFESSARVPGVEQCFRSEVSSRVANSYPPGSSVRVYYDPQSPQNAALLPGYMTRSAWEGVVFFPMFFLGWLYWGSLLLKGLRSAPKVA
ncbi:DUF3592 domain-containing protein [Thauera sp. WH-1]|uniref:DUF3592 domain-containing protein n=1 Tax=Thauera sp. WH-1 TaxID=3398230 RepID=UPI0039FBA061